MLRGKVSYIMAALAVLWGIFGYFMGWINSESAMTAIWAGLSVFGLRRAISYSNST